MLPISKKLTPFGPPKSKQRSANDKVGNEPKKPKISTPSVTIEELRGIDQIDWDSWTGEDDSVTNTSSRGTKTDSNDSYNTAFTSIAIKTNKQAANEQQETAGGIGRKRTLCRVVGLENRDRNMAVYEILDLTSNKYAKLHLQDIWNQEELPHDSVVNLVNVEIDSANVYTVNRNQGYLIVEPDFLVSVTLIVHQLWCDREAVFKQILQLFEGNRDTLRGNICHELLSKALVSKTKGTSQRMASLEEVLKSSAILHQAYAIGMSQEELDALGAELLPYITKFVHRRMSSPPPKDQKWEIHRVRDIEDMYWNPAFGMKGKLDATIDIRKPDGTFATVPMEVKTGNPNYEGKKRVRDDHVGQLTLYTTLMNTRYTNVTEGLLYYVREDFWQECSVKPPNLQALIALRNKLVVNSQSKFGNLKNLPRASVDIDYKCGRCDYKQVCSSLVKKQKEMNPEDKLTPTESTLIQVTPHLRKEDVDFFHQWFMFITMEIEISEKQKQLANLWSLAPDERKYTCIPGLKLVKCWKPTIGLADGKQYLAKLEPSETIPNLASVDIKQSDFLLIGTNDEVCISNCVVESIETEPFSITVSVESDLSGKSRSGLYHLDKVSYYNPMFINYTYLARLMGDSTQMQRLRDYLIHKRMPVIRPVKDKSLIMSLGFLSRFNENQQRVILKSLATDSFLFVKGMPGTGKTETIVGLLELLVQRGKTVLLVAYTSSAVDNIMLKYKAVSTNFIRMGKEFYVRDELQPYSYHAAISGITNVDEMRSALNKPPIIATTLMSLNHELFANRSFDYAILDEVSQSLPVTCIGALCKARKYILFGDPEQLPPVVISPAARLLQLDETLFSSMSTVANTVKLTIQYRMNKTIMNLANKLTYDNQMTCFSEELENAYIKLPTEKLRQYILGIKGRPRQIWLSLVGSKKLVRSVMFLDTSKIHAPDSYKNHSVKNNMEVLIATECLKLFLNSGLEANEIGLIAPYSAQVQALRAARSRLGLEDGAEQEIEVNTVDQYQGRDKMAIICSFAKTQIGGGFHNADSNNSDILKASILDDKRRLNVAITRAKRKLILIGNMEFLRTYDPLKALFDILVPEQVIHLQPLDVADLHALDTPLKTLY